MQVAFTKLADFLTGVFGQNGMGSIETLYDSLSRVQMGFLGLLLNAFVEAQTYIRKEEGNHGTVSTLYVPMMVLLWLI
ncbi:hypothetical protein Golax_001784 [Gossypium laxum]|uniref:Uncharacterized protein n=1 Tax=Gossypium laxum TaxID=34288 RepID=A0A7J9AR99_9ROSI|nr:hypothetical protein [Gossypium laxum]